MKGQDVEEVPIEHLRFDLSPRKELLDESHVAALAEVLDDVPPITVHAPTMRVIDGAHRAHAARSAGRSTVRAVLFDGDEAAVQIEAVRSNVSHGKPLSLAEREAAASRILELVPEWSDRRIAEASGLSPKTVARLRARATVDPARSRARLGRDGRLRPVDPSEVRRRVADVVRAEPDASTRSIAARTGASQATVRDVRARLARGDSELLPPARRRRKQTGTAPAGSVPAGPDRAGVGRDRAGAGPDRAGVGPAGTGRAGPARADLAGAAEFAPWFEQRRVEEDDWKPFVEQLPLSRVYEVADDCRRISATWRAFAIALEDRARAHRRSSSAPARRAKRTS